MRHSDRLPQMRPIERRLGRGGELSDDGGARQTCFGGPLFGGCQICTVDDDDIHTARGERLRGTWVSLDDGFCATDDKRKAGVQELIEDAEEDSTFGGEESSLEGDDSCAEDHPQHRSAAKASQSAAEDPLRAELDAVMQSSREFFALRGWEIVHVSRDRYLLNGRTIKLFLLPPGYALPYFTHISAVFGYDVAERASRIMACDGSLRQPLLDYLMQTGQNESYDQRGTENPAGVEGAGRIIDFNVAFSGDRMIEMKHATIQAEMRRIVDEEVTRMSALQPERGRASGGPAGLSRGPSAATSHPASSFNDMESTRRSAAT
mmetsp:Transcript_63487/g.200566  ORF Transcript_63487/g.200566 Transcript_63487/m.200566 type:complete len:320 (+) Transcript_63487:69-1028(+)